MKKIALAFGLVFAVATTGAFAQGAGDSNTTTTKKTEKKAEKGTPVGNKHCPIMPDETVNERSKSVTYKGQTVKVCCKKCIAKFNENPEEYLKKAQEDAKAGK